MPGLAPSPVVAAGLLTAHGGRAKVMDFADLAGWAEDDHLAALTSFLATCDLFEGRDRAPLSIAAQAAASADAARAFFEAFFRPVVIGDPPALFTGYHEPELNGSLVATPCFRWPIYGIPPDLVPGTPWHSRAEIEAQGLLHGRGLEIAWLDDPIEVYFLMVQGSGRIRLPDGSVLRVGFAGKNGHPYRSIGQNLLQQGAFCANEVTAQRVRAWLRAHPEAGAALMRSNPSFVFFREMGALSADQGPIGAMGRSLTPMLSVAVDPAFLPMGVPVWVEKVGPHPLSRLMVAQDTGGAIKGAQRADIYCGTGAAAGEVAGRIKDGGRIVTLLPTAHAHALTCES